MYNPFEQASSSAISLVDFALYYIIAFSISIILIKKESIRLFHVIMLLVFYKGILTSDLITTQAPYNAFKIILLILAIIYAIPRTRHSYLRMKPVSIAIFCMFSICFVFSVTVTKQELLFSLSQFSKYLIPVLVFIGLLQNENEVNLILYVKFILRLIFIQVIISIVKLFFIGLREIVVGTIVVNGGHIAVILPLLAVILYYLDKKEQLGYREVIYLFSYVIIAYASLKRAIWFVFPIILVYMFVRRMNVAKLNRLIWGIIFIPIVLYFGFRINHTLNPSRKTWGKFDLYYAYEYIMDYNTGKISSYRYAQGRQGGNALMVNQISKAPLNQENIIGYGAEGIKKTSYDDFDAYKYGLESKLTSGIHTYVLAYGYSSAFFLILFHLSLILMIKNRFYKIMLIGLFFWEVTQYTMGILDEYSLSIIYVFIISYIIRIIDKKDINNKLIFAENKLT